MFPAIRHTVAIPAHTLKGRRRVCVTFSVKQGEENVVHHIEVFRGSTHPNHLFIKLDGVLVLPQRIVSVFVVGVGECLAPDADVYSAAAKLPASFHESHKLRITLQLA